MTILDQIKPCDTNRPYIFISYSSLDQELVWQDVLEFQRRGYNVWLDDKNLDKTKDSWKKDALTAIENYYCKLMVFYISRWSLTSPACYDELCHTKIKRTRALHNGEVGYIAVEAEPVGNIADFRNQVHAAVMEREDIPIKEREMRAEILFDFVESFFDTNNEKVRVHPKDELNRKMDYYEEVMASFPDSAKIYETEKAEESSVAVEEPIPVPETKDTSPKPDSSPFRTFKTLNTALQDDEISGETVDFVLENAEQLETETWYLMGCKYKAGLGIEKNPEKAVEYFRIAAEGGHPDAQFWLAYAYMTGEGVEPNPEKHLLWLRKAAEQDNTDALFVLGMLLITGKGGVERDPAAAEVFIKKLTEKDEVRANELLEMLKKLQVPAEKPVPVRKLSKIPTALLKEAVEKCWDPVYCLYYADMSVWQRREIQKSYLTASTEQETPYAFHYYLLKSVDRRSVKNGFLLTDKHLYIKLENKIRTIDLLNIEKVCSGNQAYAITACYKDGALLENLDFSIYGDSFASFLNYIIENRPKTDNP